MFLRFFILSFLVLFGFGEVFSQNSFPLYSNDSKNPLLQFIDKKEPNFKEMTAVYEQHWNNAEKLPVAGWKQYKRWEYFWETRLMPDGSFPKSDMIINEIQKFEQKSKKNAVQSEKKWELLGPVNIPEKYNDARTQGLGRINVIRFDTEDPNTLWVGSAMGGIWKSTNLGQTWQNFPFMEYLSSGISDIAIYPKNSSYVYVATGDDNGAYSLGSYYSVGLIKSYYGGGNWEVTSLAKELKDRFIISRVLVHPDDFNYVVVATSQGVFKSLDGGKTWNNTLKGVAIKDMEFMPDNPNIVNAVSYGSFAGNSSFYHSSNGGDDWTKVHGLTGSNRIAITVSPSNPNKVWAVASRSYSNSFHSFLISNDKGASWEVYLDYTVHKNILGRYEGTGNDELVGQGHYDLCIAVNPVNENDIYVGGINIWKSSDGGNSFQRITNWTGGGSLPFVHADQHDLQFMPNTTDLYAAHDGGLSVSTNSGVSWADLTNGMSITQYYRIGMSKTDPNMIIGGAQDNGTNMFTSNGWVHLRAGDGMEAAIHPTNDNIMFMSYYYGEIYKSQDKGKRWSKSLSPGDVNDTAAWVTPYIIDPSNPNNMYVGFKNIYKSTTAGSNGNWKKVKNSNGQTFKSLAISPNNSNYVYAGTSYEVFMSEDAGNNWNSIFRASAEVTYLAVDPNNPKRIWITLGGFTDNYKVIEINDNVQTNVSGNLPNVPVNCIIVQPNSPDRLYIGTDIGVFVSDYNSAFWEPYGDDKPKLMITELEIFEPGKKLIAATYGRGVWRTDLDECFIEQPKVTVTGATEFCKGDSVKLEAEEGFDNYLWSNGQTGRVIYAKESGAYSVKISDKSGCFSYSKAVIVTVKDLLDLKILNGANTGFCKDGSIKLSASIGYTSYLWSNGEKGRTITVTEPGTYWVEGTANNGCSRKSETTEVVQFPVPEKPIINRDGNLLIAISANSVAGKCEWFFNGTKIENIETTTYLMTENGLYSVIITDTNGCVSEISDEFDLIVGVEEINDYYGLSVYPNPGDGEYNIAINSNISSKISFEVTNLLGEKIIELNDAIINTGENLYKINLKDSPTGIYFLIIRTPDKSKIIKIVKK